MSFYPRNPNLGQLQQTGVAGYTVNEGYVARYHIGTAAASVTSDAGIHAAVTDNAGTQTLTTGITNPLVPRNIIAVVGTIASGTAGDVKAISPIVYGTDFSGAAINETLPAFTVNTLGTVLGSKAFASVGTIVIPPHDGTTVATSIGWGEKLGMPSMFAQNRVLFATLDGTREATAPTVVFSGSVLASNTVDLNSALNSTVVDIFYVAGA